MTRDVAQRSYLNNRKTYLSQVREELQSKSRMGIDEDE